MRSCWRLCRPHLPPATKAARAANALYELGLFRGTGVDGNGNPVFTLDRAPTRYEAITMLVRLLGKEEEAISGTWDMPFTDVVNWAKPYVGYAYANGLTAGTSTTAFSGSNAVSASQYITFVLRALGYESGADFQWNRAWDLSDQIGLTDGRYNAATTGFTRGDAAIVSYSALDCKLKDRSQTLCQLLLSETSHIPDSWKQELRLAAYIGIPLDNLEKSSITGAEMTELLDSLVAYEAPDRLAQWQTMYPAFRAYEEPLLRIDVQSVLFLAAQFIGDPYTDYIFTLNSVDLRLFDLSVSETCDPLWELYGDVPTFDYGIFGVDHFGVGGALYSNVRESPISGEQLLACDVENNSFHMRDNASGLDGILAVARAAAAAHEDLAALYLYISPEEQEYLDLADERRTAILSAQSDVSAEVSGALYYVSNYGSDQNDGLTPEAAWATPQYAFSRSLAPGDAVLLERGGVWTIEPSDRWGLTSSAIKIPEGVTLGAYGEGAKPVLQGSLDQANETEFWELYSDRDGAKIWKAAQPVYYCPIIVFDDGASFASPVIPGVDGNGQYLSENSRYTPDNAAPFDVTAEMNRDLEFCCLLDLTQSGVDTDVENSALTGTLYLRCDSGNPAEVYESIALPQAACGLTLCTNAAICDITLRYFTCIGAQLDGYDGNHSQNVSNCEVGWCGGLISNYQDNGFGIFEPWIAGGALQVSSTNVSVTNSYIHDCGLFTLIVSVHNNPDDPDSCILNFEDLCFAGNLIEYCGSGVHMGDYAEMDIPGTRGYIQNFVFENNMVTHSGMGWLRSAIQRIDGVTSGFLSAFETVHSAVDNDGIYIRNNVFYKGAFSLFSLSDYHLDGTTPVNALPVFSGNTYVQYGNKPLLQKIWSSEIYYPSEETMKDVLGDESGTLVIIGR